MSDLPIQTPVRCSRAAASPDELRALCSRLQKKLEQERARLAQELHDDLTQKMTVIALEMSLLDASVQSERELSRTQLKEKVREIAQIINEMIHSLRRIKSELRPKLLDEFGLAAALEWECTEFARRTGLRCEFKAEPEEVVLKPAVAIEFFRVFQDVMSNVAQHGKARRVNVRIMQDAEGVTLCVSDDGRGIRPEELEGRQSLGLAELRARADALGAEFIIIGEAQAGTTVTIRLPAQREPK